MQRSVGEEVVVLPMGHELLEFCAMDEVGGWAVVGSLLGWSEFLSVLELLNRGSVHVCVLRSQRTSYSGCYNGKDGDQSKRHAQNQSCMTNAAGTPIMRV